MDTGEVYEILQEYLKNRYYDHANLYFNGVCGAEEFTDHNLDFEYKYAVAQMIWARFQKKEENEEKVLKRLYYPGLKTNKRSQRKRRALILLPGSIFSVESNENPLPKTRPHSRKEGEDPLMMLIAVLENQKLLWSSDEAPNQKGSGFTLEGSTKSLSYEKSEKPQPKKRLRIIFSGGDEGYQTQTTKKKNNQETEGLMEPLMENIQGAVLKERLVKDPAMEKNPTLLITCLGNGDATSAINKKLNTTDFTSAIPESEKSLNNCKATEQADRPRIGGTAAFSFNTQPGKHIPKKRLRLKGEDEDRQTKKKMKGQVVQVPVEHPMENVSALLTARLQKNNAVLVIEKQLTKTDVGAVQCRLSIPVSQVPHDNFLSEEEGKKLKNNIKVEAILIDPSGCEWDIKLSKWKSGTSWQYNLVSPWYNVVKKNNLQQHTPIKLYSFREGPRLYFALIKLQP